MRTVMMGVLVWDTTWENYNILKVFTAQILSAD